MKTVSVGIYDVFYKFNFGKLCVRVEDILVERLEFSNFIFGHLGPQFVWIGRG